MAVQENGGEGVNTDFETQALERRVLELEARDVPEFWVEFVVRGRPLEAGERLRIVYGAGPLQAIADRYSYLPSIGLSLVVVYGLGDAIVRMNARARPALALLSALVLAAIVWILGPLAVRGLTDLEPVRAVALEFLPFAALYVALSFAAFQLDGIFIGATGTRGLRNASVASSLTFIGLTWIAVPRGENVGLWLSFLAYVVLRAVFLGSYLPGVRRELGLNSPGR